MAIFTTRNEGYTIAKINRKSRNIAAARRNIANYDRFDLLLERGKKQELKDYAESRGETLSGFIRRAIQETLERDNDKIK